MDKIFISTLYFLLVLATGLCQNEDTNDPCKPKFNNATCIPINNCDPAIALLRLNDRKTLRNMFCGYIGKIPKVCCISLQNSIIFNNKTEEAATSRPKKTTTAKPEEFTTFAPETSLDPFPDRKICGRIIIQDKIVGGIPTDIDEFPWLARIKYITDNQRTMFACSASLITNLYLLTAAHCVSNENHFLKPISVRLGEWDQETEIDCVNGICNDKPVDIKINKIILYPTFSRINNTKGDIALLRLEKPVNFTDFIQPICLPTTEYITMQDYALDSSYWTSGWGVTEFGSTSPLKRKVMLEPVPTEICTGTYPKLPKSSFQNLICAGGRMGKDTCKGDSGGPLTRRVSENYQENWFLFGITSLGPSQCGKEGVPGIYTRVTKYMDWIKDNIRT